MNRSLAPVCSHESGNYDTNHIEIVLNSPYNSQIDYMMKYATNQVIDLSNINDGHLYSKPIKISRTAIFKYIGMRDGIYQISEKQSKIFVLNDIVKKTPIAFIGSCLAKGLSNRCYHMDDIFEILIANNHTAFLLTDCFTNLNEHICGYANSNYEDVFQFLRPHIFLHSSPQLYKFSNFLVTKELEAIENFYQVYAKYKTDNKFFILVNGPIFDTKKKIFDHNDVSILKHNKFYKIHLKHFEQIHNSDIYFLSIVDFLADLMLAGLVQPQDVFDDDQDHYSDFGNQLMLLLIFTTLKIPPIKYTTLLNNIDDKIIQFIEKYV